MLIKVRFSHRNPLRTSRKFGTRRTGRLEYVTPRGDGTEITNWDTVTKGLGMETDGFHVTMVHL